MHRQIVLGITLFAAAALGSPYGRSGAGTAVRSTYKSRCAVKKAPAAGGHVACPIVFDGRIPVATELTDLDAPNDLFDSDNVKGADLKFSDLLEFPAGPSSRFDGDEFKPVQVTISDASIFNNQTGFRRAELLFKGNSGQEGDPSIVGVKTIHWSVKQDAGKALNRTHEYLSVFHELGDFSGNHFNFLAGELLAGVPEGAEENDPDTWKVLDRTNTQIFATPILDDVWQNFAITMNMDDNTLQVFASEGTDPLTAVTDPVANDNSGGGQYHCGCLKKPTDTEDVVNSGFQEAGILEGLTYGSLFVEDSAYGCISL